VFLGPESERLGKLVRRRVPTHQAFRSGSRASDDLRVDLAVLFLVIADMVFKPGS
jgi:hypothetical protein